MQKHIYITRRIPEAGLKLLQEKGITYDIGEFKNPPTQKELIKALKKKPYDGVINFLTDKIDALVFDACPTAKIFANFAVGFDNIDIEEAKKRNIFVSNTPGTSAVAVAEHTVALMMALTTRLVEGDTFMRKDKYKGWDPNLLIGTDMKGKTIGLIGAGQIGTEVAKILHFGFGANVIYSDITPNPTLEQITGPTRKETAEILREADIVSLHVPLLPTTKHLINKETLATMKKTAFLINTSRGAVIDEKALVEALEKDIIRGAALDVYEFEPKVTKGLLKLPDIILTPHIASSRQSARDKMAEIAARNIISVFETGKDINSVLG
ncbi:MAG TPA: D-glycerate dehydrogenase [Candidatus Paceibacterota bacterium]|nr:D-glycerate dehydrogenase [Candidatus Paceibacterota bacterium]